MSINDTQPDPVQVSPPPVTTRHAHPDWITHRGYLGITLGAMAAFFLTAQATGWGQLVFVLIWVAAIAAVISFTRHDRRRRTIREVK